MPLWKMPLHFDSKKNKPTLLIVQGKKNNYIFESWIILAKRGEQNLNRIHSHWKGLRELRRVC